MRNPWFAVGILASVAAVVALVGCELDMSDPSPNTWYGVFLTGTDGDNSRLLWDVGAEREVRITADGQYVLYLDSSNDDQLTRRHVSSGQIHVYDLPFYRFYFWPSYEVIYLLGQSANTWDFYEVDVMSGEIHQLTHLSAEWDLIYMYDIAYGRKELYYSFKTDSLHSLYRLNLVTNEQTILASNSYDAYQDLGVSEDGNAIYYFHAKGDSLDGMYRLDVTNCQSRLISTVYPRLKLHVGKDEKFLLWGGGIIWLDENHEPDGGGGLHGGWLLSNRTNIVGTSSSNFVENYNVLTGESIGLCASNTYWVSIEGYYVIYKAYYHPDTMSPAMPIPTTCPPTWSLEP